MILLMRALISLSLFLLAGCASPSSVSGAANNAGDTLQQMRALIGRASCTDSSQCRSLALGARACGGPQGYLAWSSSQTDGDALRELAERYKAERQAQIKQKGEVSDCRFTADPGAVCQAGQCQLGSSRLGPAPMDTR